MNKTETFYGIEFEEWVKVRQIAMDHDKIEDMANFFQGIIEENKRLRKTMSVRPKDHCEKCGCTEFLCGHNRRE